MGVRHVIGLCLAAAGLAVIVAASATAPIAGCPSATADSAAITLTDGMTVDYCAGNVPAEDAFGWFFLLNGVGLVSFLGGLGLLSFQRLVDIQQQLAG
ncbi:hypothetical protein [Haloglomus salinum]|uniref:hypothetical protein n=1 Tax=Haloglomus salinum TaxID=2962673 RepID=UPI0020C96FC9|nr:hypothetical protein [Haloglomus salinum]